MTSISDSDDEEDVFPQTNLGGGYPTINIYGATPLSSPQQMYTTPTLAATYQPVSTPDSFPPLVECPATLPAIYSARMMLDHPPLLPTFASTGAVYNSSAANDHYGLIAPLQLWPLTKELGGYKSLSDFDRYTPFPNNPLAGTVTEADVISATMNAIFNPVDAVLSRNSYGYPLLASCEDSHSTPVQTFLGPMEHLSRVDRSWSFWNGQRYVQFAVMEFKRPGALEPGEWGTAYTNGTVVRGKGSKVCRQLKKYGYGFDTPFVGCFDGKVLILLYLAGGREQWYHPTLLAAPNTPGYWRWIDNQNEMKRNAYVFLREALQWKLQQQGLPH